VGKKERERREQTNILRSPASIITDYILFTWMEYDQKTQVFLFPTSVRWWFEE
jgi:hypothetical protein